jgi:hypothetical protein
MPNYILVHTKKEESLREPANKPEGKDPKGLLGRLGGAEPAEARQ